MKFYCLGDEDTVRGFRLAGVEGQAVHSAAEAVQALEDAGARPEVGIIVLTQEIAGTIAEPVRAFRLERTRPLLVEIPGPAGPLRRRTSLRQMVHSAVGIRVEKGA